MGEKQQDQVTIEINEELALVRVGTVIEIPIRTSAKDDQEFIAQLGNDPDVVEAISQLLSAALSYRDSAPHRADHEIRYSKMVLFYDESSGQPVNIGWSKL